MATAVPPSKLRILVLTSTYPRWRGDTVPPFVHELARRLAGEFEVHVLAPHAPGSVVEEELDGVHVHRFRYLPERLETLAYGGGILPGLRRRPWRLAGLAPLLMAEYLAARHLLHRKDFRLIHAHWVVPHGFIGACLKGGRRLLCTSHGSDLFALDRFWLRPLKRFAFSKADEVSVVSDVLRRKSAGLIPRTIPVRVMPMGIDTRVFSPSAETTGREGILYVGRLIHEKGGETLLHAMRQLRERGIHTRLTFVGDGPARGRLEQLSHEFGISQQVAFVGGMPNQALPAHYRQAAALVFPSLLGPRGQQEGMGLVPLEALACGCPVIASRLPSISEILRDGRDGWLFTPGDAGALAECIGQALANPALAALRAESGRRAVVGAYDWDIVADGYSKLYTRLIADDGQCASRVTSSR